MNFVGDARVSLLVEEESSKIETLQFCPNEEIGPTTSVFKHQTGGWKASSIILFTELCLCIADYGIITNLVVYLKTELLEDNVEAASHASTWLGTCYLTTLMGAYLSDSYLGNYLTIMYFGIIYLIGMVTLTLSALLSILKHSPFFTYMGLYLISLGSGSIKPCISAFGADQFDKTETRAKTSFFSLYYLSVKIAIFFASTVIVWIQDNYGWTIGFGIPTLASGIAFISFMAGTKYYRYRKPRGSSFTRLCQVIVAASRKCNLNLSEGISPFYQAEVKSGNPQDNDELEPTPGFR